MKKVVLKLEFADEKIKQKVMKKVSGLTGLESIAFDQKEKKLVVTGAIDPVDLVAKVKKICRTDIVTVGPAKEPEKKKEEPEKKKEDPKKDEKKKEEAPKAYPAYYFHHPYYYQNQLQPYQQPQVAAATPLPPYYQRSVEEDPTGCVIC